MTNGTVSDEEKRLAERKKLALLEKEIAEAEQATAEALLATRIAQFPASESKQIAGTTTTDSQSGYIAELAAYSALFAGADAIASIIKHKDSGEAERTILIVDSLDFAGEDVLFLQVDKQLEHWERELTEQETTNQEILKASKRVTLAGFSSILAAPPKFSMLWLV